jgi:hypothetical protein
MVNRVLCPPIKNGSANRKKVSKFRKFPHLWKVRKSNLVSPQVCGFAIFRICLRTATAYRYLCRYRKLATWHSIRNIMKMDLRYTHLYLFILFFLPPDQYSVFGMQIPIEACKYELWVKMKGQYMSKNVWKPFNFYMVQGNFGSIMVALR